MPSAAPPFLYHPSFFGFSEIYNNLSPSTPDNHSHRTQVFLQVHLLQTEQIEHRGRIGRRHGSRQQQASQQRQGYLGSRMGREIIDEPAEMLQKIRMTPINKIKGFNGIYKLFGYICKKECDKKSYKQLFSIMSEPIVPSIVA